MFKRLSRGVLSGFVAVLALAGGVVTNSNSGSAEQGLALTVGRFDIDESLSKGDEYVLHGFGVTNRGSEPATFRVLASPMPGQRETAVPKEWLAMSEETFVVEAGETHHVSMTLNIPAAARPGDYRTLLRAEMVADGAGTRVGAAVGAPLTFEVEPATPLESVTIHTQEAVDGLEWPLAAFMGLSVMLGGIWLARRNLDFSVQRRPR